MGHVEWFHQKKYKSTYCDSISTFFADTHGGSRSRSNMLLPQQLATPVPFPLKYIAIEFIQTPRLHTSDISEFFGKAAFRVNIGNEKPICLENPDPHTYGQGANAIRFSIDRYIDVGEPINVEMAMPKHSISHDFSVKIKLIPGRLKSKGTHDCICEMLTIMREGCICGGI